MIGDRMTLRGASTKDGVGQDPIDWVIRNGTSGHIGCNEECAFCKNPFDRLRKLVKHLEDCKVEKSRDKQGICPSPMQYLALRRKDQLCKSALKQMEQQTNQDGK
ncbi:hypothetical protein FGG08_004318 [Glutinoglossum americanum]|uniref:Uncharacterized protein n=1 Tax=Glutinoglossum americanum TaxID=1670608 RepID=A0A9P8L2M5_9PEZI|nr:hypothetical protein FGG08_004318 [Glutinoglossum americanum]